MRIIFQHIIGAVIGGAMTKPLWLLHLEKVLSLGLSCLGIVWLLVQIALKLEHWQ